jgi:protein-export membrane protein SecD
MLRTLKGRFAIIVAVLLVSGFYLFTRGIKLGLDLQGGMHLVLEVEDRDGTLTPEARADATDRALKIIRTRIDQFGVEEPIIQKVGADRIIVELAGIDDEDRAKEIIQSTAYLEFQLVTDGRELRSALPRIDRALLDAGAADAAAAPATPGALTPAATPQDDVRRLLFGEQDTTAVAAGEDGEDAAAPATPQSRPLTSVLMEGRQPGQFLVAVSDTARVSRWLALPEVQRLMPRNTVLRWGSELVGAGAQLYRPLYALEARPFMTGEFLEDAIAGRDPQFNQTIVSFTLSRRGGRIFERVTADHVGDFIAIVLDQEVFSAPEIRSRIGARGQIEMGQAPLSQAQDLALVLRAGALPAPLQILEERTVGPSLGADSIEQGRIAGIVGIVLVILIMLFYYRLAGLMALGALAVYVVLVLGGLAGFNATLTVPGIAGLILSIGMAVDANVLIFERIREELALGRAPRTAVDEGFRNAMSAIVDSNATTLMTALVLFQFGTGPVQGFAVTLSIGIIASFFSAVFVTRALFQLYMERRRGAEPLSI